MKFSLKANLKARYALFSALMAFLPPEPAYAQSRSQNVRFERVVEVVAFEQVEKWGGSFFVRTRPTDKQLSERDQFRRLFPGLDHQAAEIDTVLEQILGKPFEADAINEQEIWARFRNLWEWSNRALRTDARLLKELEQLREYPTRPSIFEIARIVTSYGHIPIKSPETTTHIFLTLTARLGIPRDRMAIATCLTSDGEHDYIAFFINRRWHYFDVGFGLESVELPRSIGIIRSVPGETTADYKHPFLLKFPTLDPLSGRAPLLED